MALIVSEDVKTEAFKLYFGLLFWPAFEISKSCQMLLVLFKVFACQRR